MALKPNAINQQFFKDYSRYYYSLGGRWSGKTFDSLFAIIVRLQHWQTKACLMRKVYGSIKDTLFSDCKDVLKHAGVEFTSTVSPLGIKFKNGSEIIFKGADDPEKLKGLSSVSLVLMDEANEFTRQDFETIDQSIRGDHHHSIYLCHNPVPKLPGSLYWFEEQFRVPTETGVVNRYYDETLGSYVSTLRTTYKHNEYCPEHVKRRLEGYKITNPDLYKLWALGEYTDLKGAAFKNWDIIHELPEGLDDPGYGLDFGFSNDPAACVRVWVNSSDIYIQGLIYSTGLTNVELYDTMISKGIDQYDEVIADSAEPKSIQDLYDRGLLNISGVHKKPNYKVEMVNIMQAYKIHLLDGDTDLQREFQTYSWQQDKAGNQIPKLQDGNDHYIDAVIMYCHEKLGGISSVVY